MHYSYRKQNKKTIPLTQIFVLNSIYLCTCLFILASWTNDLQAHVGRSPRENVPAMSAVALLLPQCFNPENKSRRRNLIFHLMMEEIIWRRKQRLRRGFTVLGALSSFVSAMLIRSEVSPSLSPSLAIWLRLHISSGSCRRHDVLLHF